MDVSSILTTARGIKGAFFMLTALSLTAYRFPANTVVEDHALFDYVIVGAGTAGSIVANRLTEDPKVSVCLIEAGGDPPLDANFPALFAFSPLSRMDWNFTSEDDGYTAQYRKQKYLDLASGKVLGGSSTINHFYHVRGGPEDYKDWVKASGDESWSWRNLLPYFKKSERLEDEYILNSASGKYYGTNGYVGITRENRDLPLKYLKAFEEVGHDIVDNINGEKILGYTRPMFTISGGTRQSSAESYLSPIKDRQNLFVVKNTLVTKINLDNNNQATGVQCSAADGSVFTINAQKEVIISAGVFNTPKLLMLSGIGPKDHLNDLGINVVSDLPVGENLQDHLAVTLIHKLESTDIVPVFDPTKFPLPTLVGYGALNKSQGYPDYMTLHLIGRNDPGSLLQFCTLILGLHDDVCERIYTAGINTEILFSTVNVLRPKSRGKVLLKSTNPEDPPKIYTGFLSDSSDLERSVDYIEDFLRVTESSHFKGVGAEMVNFDFPNCSDMDTNTRKYWKCYVLNMMASFFHYSCTCPMGTVLDSNLRVHGVSKLRVVDASAMPNILGSKINAGVLVLAEKASDLIKETAICQK